MVLNQCKDYKKLYATGLDGFKNAKYAVYFFHIWPISLLIFAGSFGGRYHSEKEKQNGGYWRQKSKRAC